MGGKRKESRQWRRRAVGVGLLLLGALALLVWWRAMHWRPDEGAFARQGALIGAQNGTVNFDTLRALGASFVYLRASDGAMGKDPALSENLEAARRAGLEVGVVHRFDPCAPADGQSANFVTVVPRDARLLPPALELTGSADQCGGKGSDAAVESELMTLVNQLEIHTGQGVILKPDRAFEKRYGAAARIERELWVSGNWAEPGYGGRPWRLWTANDAVRTEAAAEPLAWVAARP